MPCMLSTRSMVMRSSPRTRPEARGPWRGSTGTTTLMPRRCSCFARNARKSIDAARAHAKAMAANEPGLVLSTRRPRHPRVHGAVGLVAQPPASSWFLGIRLPAARECDVLVAKAKGTLVPGAHVLGCLGALVIFGRAIEPPTRREETLDVCQIGRRRGIVVSVRQQVGVAEDRDEHLVEVRLKGQGRRRPDGHDAVVLAGTRCPAAATSEEPVPHEVLLATRPSPVGSLIVSTEELQTVSRFTPHRQVALGAGYNFPFTMRGPGRVGHVSLTEP